MAKRILVVDDSRSIRKLVGDALLQAGFDVAEAEDGEHGLILLEDGGEVDLVLSDENMPGVQGIEFVAMPRKLSQHQFTPVVMLTSEQSREAKDAGRKLGIAGWIPKPFNPADVVARVQQLLY